MDVDLGESAARKRFCEIIANPSPPLAEAALAIAEEEYPRLVAETYLSRLDEFARAVVARLSSQRDVASTLRSMRTVLFEEASLRGNAEAYYDPRNSFLNEVLDRKLGNPIALSVIYMEVAARIGLPAQGVGLPGHFLVKVVVGDREIFIDSFHGGELLTAAECATRLHAVAPGRPLEPQHLEGVTHRQILRRMLNNLKKIYVEAGDDIRSLWVLDRLVLLVPGDALARRDRGLVEARLGGTRAALVDLEAYLKAVPEESEDGRAVREVVKQLMSRSGIFN